MSVVTLCPAVIPVELPERRQWVVWQFEERDGKPTKVPYQAAAPTKRASSTNPATWAPFELALEVARAGKAAGIGYVIVALDPYTGVDLDDCYDAAGELHPTAGAIVGRLDSYTEQSQSGRGVHVLIRAELNGSHKTRTEKTPWGGGIEVYDQERYFCMTGAHVRGTPETIEPRQAQLELVLDEFLPKRDERPSAPPAPQPVDVDDLELLELARRARNGAAFEALFAGDWQGRYPSQSEADLALCSTLAFWTGRDPGRIDRLFRSSGLLREKWERDDYRERTIDEAIAGCPDVYSPGVTRNVRGTSTPPDSSLKERREVPTDIPGKCDLRAILDEFGELLVMPDPGPVEVALAGVVANYAPGDPVWPLLVGPPGCGKSEVVMALREAPQVWPLSSLTPLTLLSGYERKGKATGPPPSMLLQIGRFGILAFKDLTTVLSMHREARAQIISQLREVADGATEKAFGNGLRLEWQGKLGFIAGVTPVIDEQHAFVAVMGERFVLYRMPEVERAKVARRALERRAREAELRERIRTHVGQFLAGFRDVGYLQLPGEFTEPLIELADVVTRARSAVARDYQSRDVLYLPEPEAPTRFAKQVAQLMAAMLAIGVDESEAWRVGRKVGWDSVPAVRTTVLRLLSREPGELTRAELAGQTGLPQTTVVRVTEDLAMLELATQRKNESGHWMIAASPTLRGYGELP